MSPSPSRSVMIVFIALDGLAWHGSDRRRSVSFSTWLIHWASLPKSHPCYHDVRTCSFLGLPGTPRSTYPWISIWIVDLLDLVFPRWTLRRVPHLGSCEWCCDGPGSADLSLGEIQVFMSFDVYPEVRLLAGSIISQPRLVSKSFWGDPVAAAAAAAKSLPSRPTLCDPVFYF